ncbi:hypothetical protein [Bordetella sp. 15P40C-2]|uniref:hypothetical protein n=1 Tax=Bordetella sp. 15P40C-2 TaxID=2572246 RepID=UPI001322166F|nr:hypothetical protein [Bordetella sp. 15P40C-2]MVW72808.1 hypothetical protein [Bordetella sp. 15P40C-2]
MDRFAESRKLFYFGALTRRCGVKRGHSSQYCGSTHQLTGISAALAVGGNSSTTRTTMADFGWLGMVVLDALVHAGGRHMISGHYALLRALQQRDGQATRIVVQTDMLHDGQAILALKRD